MQQGTARPDASVIIPTYNRAALVDRMLAQLTRQDVPPDQFEVIVSDDGSADDTRAVVERYADRLRLGYHYQADQGMRVGLARNEGARLASAPILVFVDSGGMVGPEFVRRHLAAHAESARPRSVLGYAWGYNPMVDPLPGLAEALATRPPERVLADLRDNPALRDVRHDALAAYDFELARMPLAWRACFTNNFSVRAEDYWAIGGFDESYVEWGAEDLDLGLRLERHGVTPCFRRDAWIIEWPHPRSMADRWQELIANMARFLGKFPEPAVEIGMALVEDGEYWRWEQDWLDLLRWADEARDRDVAGEISHVLRRTGPGERVAVIGCGGVLPPGLAGVEVADFDRPLLDAATRANGLVTGHHTIGLRTQLPDQSVDTVIITSRLDGLWDRWGRNLMAEAQRIGRKVHTSGAQS